MVAMNFILRAKIAAGVVVVILVVVEGQILDVTN
jgi:hypothetical protein